MKSSSHPQNGTRSRRLRVLLVMALCAVVMVVAVAAVAQLNAGGSETPAASEEADATDSEAADDAEAEAEEAAYQAALEEVRTIYDVDASAQVRSELDDEIAEGGHTEDDPLVEENPFGTNTLSWYVYFTTEDAVSVSYTVRGNDASGIADFSAVPWGGDAYATEHEFQVIGLIPGEENTVTLTLTDEAGNARDVTLTGSVSELQGTEEERLDSKEGTSTAELADGLYVILGNDSSSRDFTYYYDNDGQIRGEIPIIGYRAHRLLFDDGGMYYSISTTKIAKVDRLGQVVAVYDTGDYELHHDYVFDDDGNLLVLASDANTEVALDGTATENTDERGGGQSVEDKLIRIDVTTGEVEEVLDMADLFPDVKARAEVAEDGDLDWVHLNAIQWLGDGSVIVSSRETSTIVKIDDVYGTPTVDYLLGGEAFWDGTEYEGLLLEKNGTFSSNGGQHCVTYIEDDALAEGQYYLLVYDNDFGSSESYPDMDWSELGDDVATTLADGTVSYCRLFLVDENERTYSLVNQVEVPFSGYVSSVQPLGGNVLVDSGQAEVFGEYDENGELIASFTMEAEKYLYRVFKYDFAGFYFAE